MGRLEEWGKRFERDHGIERMPKKIKRPRDQGGEHAALWVVSMIMLVVGLITMIFMREIGVPLVLLALLGFGLVFFASDSFFKDPPAPKS